MWNSPAALLNPGTPFWSKKLRLPDYSVASAKAIRNPDRHRGYYRNPPSDWEQQARRRPYRDYGYFDYDRRPRYPRRTLQREQLLLSVTQSEPRSAKNLDRVLRPKASQHPFDHAVTCVA